MANQMVMFRRENREIVSTEVSITLRMNLFFPFVKARQDDMLVVAGVFYRWKSEGEPEVALFRRKVGDTGAGLYEFPGGKVEDGESEKQALVRELEEELSVLARVEDFLGETRFRGFSGREILLKVYFVSADLTGMQLHEHDDCQWVSISTLVEGGTHAFVLKSLSEGDRPLMEACFQTLSKRPTA
jgi:mutator protein MutT